MAKRVGVWIGVLPEATVGRVEEVERIGRSCAASRGWQVAEVYRPEAAEDVGIMNRPAIRRMLEDLREGHIQGLILSELAQLAGDTEELVELAEKLDEHGADIISLKEGIDTSTSDGGLFYTLLDGVVQGSQDGGTRRDAASARASGEGAKHLGGQATFGYRWQDGCLVPDPKEAPIRRRIYELFLEHRRKKTVARLLNEAGYRTRRGAEFSDTTVGRLLRDPTAKGLHRANRTRSLGRDRGWVLKPREEWVCSDVEPVVSEEMWERCNRILDDQKKGPGPSRKVVNLFSGIVLCHCGEKMYVPSNSPKYTCLACRNKIRTDDLEEIFREQLRSFQLSPTEIRDHLDHVDERLREKEELLQSLRAEGEAIRDEMDKLYALYLNDQISGQGFSARHGPLEKRETQRKEELVEVQSEIDFLRIQHLSRDEVLHEARDLYSRWPHLEFDAKRRILETLVDEIIIGRDGEITMHLAYPLPLAQ